VNKYNKTPKIR